MKMLVSPSSLAPLVSGLGLGLVVLGSPLTTFGQAYQPQGPFNAGNVSTQRQMSLIPSAYQQQGVPAANTGLQYGAPQAPAYQSQPTPTTQTRRSTPQTAAPIYAPTPPFQLPPAYAQQGLYPQPQPYPGYAQTQPAPIYQTPINVPQSTSTSREISALKLKNKEQDRRLSVLEARGSNSRPSTTTGYTKYTVRWGDTLWSIAERHGASESAIKSANGRTTDNLREGETLLIPDTSGTYVPSTPGLGSSGSTHIVKPGQSLSKIAASYHVSTRSLQETNGITNPDVIEVGSVLTIPGRGRTVKPKAKTRYVSKPSKPKEEVVYSAVPPPASQGLGNVPNTSGPRGVTSYRVEAGDEIQTVARNFGTTPAELQRINKLSSQKLPATGEEIIVPLPGSLSL